MPNVSMAPPIVHQFFDDSGNPLAAGRLYTYQAGTSTPKPTYQNAAGTITHANPIVLDSAGRALIFLEDGSYRFALANADDATVWTIDNIAGGATMNIAGNHTDLKSIVPNTVDFVRTLGRLADNDGGGWWYYWDSTSTAADDGGMVIIPNTLPAAGRWIGVMPHDRRLNVRIYGAACDGTTIDFAALQACDAWCHANGCVILIDGPLRITADPSIQSKVYLPPGGSFVLGDINPEIDVLIDSADKSRKFTCTTTYYPILKVSEVFPEWFGETNMLHPITTQVILNLADQSTKFLAETVMLRASGTGANVGFTVGGLLTAASAGVAVDLEVGGALSMPSGGTIAQGVEPISAIARTDLSHGGKVLCLGADKGNTIQRSENQTKGATVVHPSYAGIGYPVGSIDIELTDASSELRLGRGDSTSYAMTEIGFYTAANTTTTEGTRRGYFAINGGFVVGNPTGGSPGAGSINAQAVYDDNVLLTGYVLDKAYNPECNMAEWAKKAPVAAEEFDRRAEMLLDVEQCSEFIESRRVLPTFEGVESTGKIPSTGAMIQKLWEVVEIQAVHIKQLNDRLKKLEG
jgi:hypothetical protein